VNEYHHRTEPTKGFYLARPWRHKAHLKSMFSGQSTNISHIADMWQNFAKYSYNCNGNYQCSRSALLYIPKIMLLPHHTWLKHAATAHSKNMLLYCLILKNYNSGNVAGQDWEFSRIGTGKQYCDEWCIP
jgi:hypothetical protein